MASTANIASTSTQNSGIQNPVSGQRDAPNKSTMKSSGSAKTSERGGRKESPVDTGRRPQQRAWTSTSNPVSQRGATPAQANGSTMPSKGLSTVKTVAQKDVGLSDKHGHDRLRYILAAAVGLSVVFTTKTGEKFEGIFAGSATTGNSTKITLKMTRKAQNNPNQINGVAAREAALVGTSPEHAMTFDLKDMVDLSIPEFSLPEASRYMNGANASFQTDADISGNANRGERTLQRWEPDGPESMDFSLESGSTEQWDQFATHNQMFGGKSTYDESLYTTEIDRKAPGYKQREAEAARLAREIEGAVSTNAHVREERGQSNEQDYEDEESKYSGVKRDDPNVPTLPTGGLSKYTPPGRRTLAASTVPGVPVDSAIISAQLSKPDVPKQAPPKAVSGKPNASGETTTILDQSRPSPAIQPAADTPAKARAANTSASTQSKGNVDNPTEDVENKVLDHFRQFANAERARVAERKRAQATQDRTAKLNDLKLFASNFKLKTPIPTDLVGILAKDPAKQEAIIEKAQKDHEEAKTAVIPPAVSVPTAPAAASAASAAPAKQPSVAKYDGIQQIPDRSSFNKGRAGGYIHGTVRPERQPQQHAQFSGRGVTVFNQRTGPIQERKTQMIQNPMPLPDGRTPPIGPMADQQGIATPQRSNMHTPTSAISATKMNARAVEFRPTAPTFNPSAASNTPSSPASIQRTGSLSRAASPSSFFGARKPKPVTERFSVATNFNPIKRMRQEVEARKSGDKSDEPVKDYAYNGGIPNAYHTGPVWIVKDENKDKSYASAFDRSGISGSPSQTRTTSSHHLPYAAQMPPTMNGGMPQISTPQHVAHASHHYGPQFDEHRLHSSQVFASPGMSSRQISNFSSPMAPPAQLAYGQQPYFSTPNGHMPMRQYPNTPGMMHAQAGQMTAPMMVQQASSGPYMTVPQGYNHMQMYSPSPSHVYPQTNGYPSPSRGAPIMMQQGSQQSHHGGQQVMYTMPGQAGPMMYNQQGQFGTIRGAYGGPQVPYGSSPHQAHHMQQRAMSSGYGQKGMSQAMAQNQGPPSNAPQQPAAYAQMELTSEDNK